MANSDAFYNEIKLEVNTVLSELGTQYNVRTAGAYNPATLSTANGVSRTVTGLVADQKAALSFTAGQGVWIGEKSLILVADANPLPGEEVEVEGQWFPLSKVVPIKPADVVVVYMLDVTR